MNRIPIRKHGEVVAHALVDAEDFARLSQWSWRPHPSGYVTRGTNRERTILMHRELMGLTKGDGLEVDHINHDRLDNRRQNLRVVTRGENARNRRADKTSTSRHLGVSWDSTHGKWVASASANGKRISLGYFSEEKDAAGRAREWRSENTPFVHEVAS